MKFKPWNTDKWLSLSGSIIPWDKVEHFLLGVILEALLLWAPITPAENLFFFSLAAWGWEVKDGLKAYDDNGHVEGFSWKDLIAGYAGGALALIVRPIWGAL